MKICTIIAKNYLAHARTLSESFLRHHPGEECFVLVIDEVDGYVDATREPFTLVRPEQIGLAAWDEMRGAYDVMELSTAVKPWLLRHLLRNHDDGSGVAYFDPDIQIASRMVELEKTLREHSAVLTPHVTRGMPRDGKKPSEIDILLAGVYNLGFIGLSNSGPAHELLDWWSERLLTDCHVAPDKGLFVDQRWVDFVPGLVADLDIFRDPTYNVAYWNLPERELSVADDGGCLVNGRPLRFFHFSGYSPDRPETLSKHQTRVLITDDEVLRELCFAYAAALTARGFEDVRDLPYEHDLLPSQLRLTKLMRGLYRAGVEAKELPRSLFTTAGEADFIAWLNEPSHAEPGITRYLHAVWEHRVDVQRAYSQPGGRDREGFLGWCAVHGREQLGIPETLLPRHPLEQAAEEPDERTVGASAATTVTPSHDDLPSSGPPFGVNVAGYLRSELGIGEAARQLISALDAVGVPALPVGLFAPGSRQGHGYVAGHHDRNPFSINLICVNADGLPAFAEEAGAGFFAGKHNIGVWWWETSEFPDRYMHAFPYVDEVWVGSRFIAEALSAVSPVPVVHVPVALEFPHAPALRPGQLGLPDAFTFLFSFDYSSVLARKNPVGLVEAYARAFSPDDGTALVLKCINGHLHPSDHRKVRAAVADREDIVLVDRYLDRSEKDRLMASCDCYVSLHRSEGFGLTLAEAMYLGRPVIATGYSGNTDFMNGGNSYLVGYDLVTIGEGADPYPPGGHWAEPDLDEAARLMRHVFEHPEEAAERGHRAAVDIRAGHAPVVVGHALQRRLERVTARLDGQRAAEAVSFQPTESRQRVERLLSQGGAPTAPSRFGKPGAAARKLLLRGLRPYTAYQAQVDRALVDALDATAERQAADARRAQERVTESFVTAMAELRRQRAHSAAERSRVDTIIEQLRAHDERLAKPERLVAETRALPYMSSDVFGTFDAGPAGTVLGYDEPRAVEGENSYREFEDLFRGSERFIADRQRRYLELIDGLSPIVDAGCGRGEFLDVLRDAGMEGVGVDLDAGMVARCRAKGHTGAVQADAVEYLRAQEDASLGLVFSAQVVEHLPPATLRELLSVAAAKLQPGGLLIAETVNPHSVAAMKAFWVDVTHQHPLFPESMLAFCRIAGFPSAYVFHPNGIGDIEVDRYATGEYAVIAKR